MNEECCERLLSELAPLIRAPSSAIAASLLAKRLAFLATGACLYAMSACDKGLRLTPDNCLIEYGHDGRLWTSSMPLHDLDPIGYADGERPLWRENLVRTLFAELLAPVWHTLHRVGGISPRVLWENTAVRVYSLYDRRLAEIETPCIRQRCDDDFDWLLHRAEPALFGLDHNPLQRFRRDPTQLNGREVRLRRTCCLYYKTTDPVEYCGTCPLLRRKALPPGQP
nr:IucA/IucC family C-terminal-domain containing protein [Marinobacterium ramblicola]